MNKDKAEDLSRKSVHYQYCFQDNTAHGQDTRLHTDGIHFSAGIELDSRWAKDMLSRYLGKYQSEKIAQAY